MDGEAKGCGLVDEYFLGSDVFSYFLTEIEVECDGLLRGEGQNVD